MSVVKRKKDKEILKAHNRKLLPQSLHPLHIATQYLFAGSFENNDC